MNHAAASSKTPGYTGRFAPSPSGPLHFGSLVTAVASYMQARNNNGRWLLRIDNIDPPRELANADQLIRTSLEAHGLFWDELIYQQDCYPHYQQALNTLIKRHRAYYCECTRNAIKARGPHYDGFCRYRQLPAAGCAVRFLNSWATSQLYDRVQGHCSIEDAVAAEDFVIRRKDGLFGYHLASVVDDIRLRITEVVRGADLLGPSACQQALFNALGAPCPQFMHVPVAASEAGRKLSKQNYARPLDDSQAAANLVTALQFLGQPCPKQLAKADVTSVIDWADAHWSCERIAPNREIIIA